MSRKARKLGEINVKKFSKKSLDSPDPRAYSPAPVAVLKGAVTGAGIGERSGNATFEDSNRR
ncbi:MAG: hypothetical protein QOJ70_515 [Acidobacteriota bacterium]|jgi:hypothetical protein|nr:hypothetical protein [Acidobacteriota bacterium]